MTSIGTLVEIFTSNSITSWNEDDGTWAPSISDSHWDVGNGSYRDEHAAGKELAAPAARYEN